MATTSDQHIHGLIQALKEVSDSSVDDQVQQLLLVNQQLQLEIAKHKETRFRLQKLSQAIEHAGDAILITDLKGDIEYINPAFSRITGYKPEEVIGKNPRILKSTAQDESVYADLWQTIKAGQTWHGAMIERRKDGSFYPANMSIAPITDKGGKITNFISVQHDASERQELEERMRETQKMEALGVLVGGIAHDFNNMLAGIICNLFIARRKVNADSPAINAITNAEQIAESATNMIKQLLAFSRKDTVKIHPFSFNVFIRDAVKLAQISVPENILFTFKCCDEQLMLRGDTTQLQQILMNLLNNARDALAEVNHQRPGISLIVEKFEPDSSFLKRFPAMQASQFIHMSLLDNGCGIPEEQINKVMEPFFTTKSVGKGTGLGLSMVFDAVHAHGGVIDIDSSPGVGSTFHIYLPVDTNALETEQSKEESPLHFGNGECILIADDDPVVRMSGRSVLESLGYKVMEASDGGEAVQIFSSHSDEINLVILDLVMPRLGGIQAAAQMRNINPAVRTIYITSYEPGKFDKFSPQADEITLRKPYSIKQLSHTIHHQLAQI